MIFVRCSSMKYMLVAQELDISDLEDHVEPQFVAHFFQYLSSLDLFRRQLRDDASVHETPQALHVVWIPLAVYSAVLALLEVED